MNKIKKLTQVIRDNADIDYGIIQTLNKIDNQSSKLEQQNKELIEVLKLAWNNVEGFQCDECPCEIDNTCDIIIIKTTLEKYK